MAEPTPYSPSSVVLPNGMPEQPVFSIEEIGTRRYAETVSELRPRDDYGRLYPFIGAAAKTSASYGSEEPLFGLCTAGGEIVVDPVYGEAELLERGGKEIYALKKFIGTSTDIKDDAVDYTRSNTRFERAETTFAALDGSKAVTYADCELHPEVYDAWWEDIPPDSDFISVYDGVGWGAMDYDLELVYPCAERFPVQFCEGLAAVWNGAGDEYSYINLDGETVLGPYPAPERMDETADYYTFAIQRLYFSHGLATFKQGGLWGFIDKTGRHIGEIRYTGVETCFGDYCKAYIYKTDPETGISAFTSYALDRSGKILTESADSEGIARLDEEFFWIRGNEGDITLMDGQGEALPLTVSPDRLLANGWLMQLNYDAGQYVSCSLEKDGEVIKLPFEVREGLPGDTFLVVSQSVGEDGLRVYAWSVADKTGALLIEDQPGDVYPRPSGRLEVCVYQANTSPCYGLWDPVSLTEILPARYQELYEFGDVFAVREGMYGGLVDGGGNWIVKRSLLDTLPD
jgi:hypothetical protein